MSTGIYIGSKPVLDFSDLSGLDSILVIDASASDLRLVSYSQWAASYARLDQAQTFTAFSIFAVGALFYQSITVTADVTVMGTVAAESASLGATGLFQQSSPSVSAAGTSQGTATALTSAINQVTSASGAAEGVRLAYSTGQIQYVGNESGAVVKVYPPTGAAIDDLGLNNFYTLADNAHKQFVCVSATKWLSF